MARKHTALRDARRPASSPGGRIDEASLVGMHVGDRYKLIELIGEGGMGGVFRAEQLASRRIVALKLLHPELAHIEYVVRRFQREAQVASRLSHPNIVEVLDFGESSGHLFLAMELLTGTSLADRMADGGLGSIANALAILGQVLDALDHAHARGVVHRDLKPENIMLVPAAGAPGSEQVKLLDFGIAKLADDAPKGAKPLTQAGIPLGTPHYMSPEQAAGESTDARSDLYACGVILYEMLTGRPPFDADNAVRLLSLHLTKTPVPVRAAAPRAQIPEALERVVLRALEKRRDDRFGSAAELRRALEPFASGSVGAAPLPRPSNAVTARRLRLATGAIAVALTALLLADHHCGRPRAVAARGAPEAADAHAHDEHAREPRVHEQHASVAPAPVVAPLPTRRAPSSNVPAKRRKPRAR
jgi:serine/threonine protein kinase